MNQPYHECPSFERCSCNFCPLDPDLRDKTAEKREETCKATKPTRHRIALKYPELLPMQGFTAREWHGKQRWEGKTPQQKDEIRTRLSKTAIKPLKQAS